MTQLSAAERAAIVAKLVPDYQWRPTLADLPRGARLVDMRGKHVKTKGSKAISLGNAPVCLLGGTFEVDQPSDAGWQVFKNEKWGDDLISWGRDKPGTVSVFGARTIRGADPLPPPKSPQTRSDLKLHVAHVWSTETRDDWLEDDAKLGAFIEHCLIDGTWVWISSRPGRGNRVGRVPLYTVRNTLVHVACQPDPRKRADACGPGKSCYIVWKGSAPGERADMEGVLIRIDSRPGKGRHVLPPGRYSNVWVLWTGKGAAPITTRPGVEVITDARVWEEARAKWIRQHEGAWDAPAEPPPPPPPPSAAFPVELSKDNRRARVVLDQAVPPTAYDTRLVLTVHDADWHREGTLRINDHGPIVLFGAGVTGAGHNERVVEVEFEIPPEVVAGLDDHELVFEWVETGGFRVDAARIEHEVDEGEDDDGEEPAPGPELTAAFDKFREGATGLVAQLEEDVARTVKGGA